MPPPPLQHAESEQQLTRRRSGTAPAQSEADASAGTSKRHPGGEADAAARHRQLQADTAYRQRQLEQRTAAVTFAEPELEAGSWKLEAAAAPGGQPAPGPAHAVDASSTAVAQPTVQAAETEGRAVDASSAAPAQPTAQAAEAEGGGVDAASLEAELPEESAWLQELARERERNAVPWLRAAAADEPPVSERFR